MDYGSDARVRWPARSGQQRPRSSQPDGRLDGHAGPQQMILILTWIEADSDGKALDDLDVVAGGVFRRQQAEFLAAGARQRLDIAAIFAAEGVDVNRDLLPLMHPAQLSL